MFKEKSHDIYQNCLEFLNKYPFTICFRPKKHSKVLQMHINDDEKVYYCFAGQKTLSRFSLASSCVVVLTSKRILFAKKRIFPGYFYTSITPDMLNDFNINRGILWGYICIDTIKEEIHITNIDPKALKEIEDYLSKYMIEQKRKFANIQKKASK